MDNLKFWCQTVLPLVYDDSLSYYELLNKVVKYLNNMISDVSNLQYEVQHSVSRMNLIESDLITAKQNISQNAEDINQNKLDISQIQNELADIGIETYIPGDYVLIDNNAAYSGFVDELNLAYFMIPIAKPIQSGCEVYLEAASFYLSNGNGYISISAPASTNYSVTAEPSQVPKYIKIIVQSNSQDGTFVIGGETVSKYEPLTFVIKGTFRAQVILPPQ